MYARRLRCRIQNWDSLFRQSGTPSGPNRRDSPWSCSGGITLDRTTHLSNGSFIRNFSLTPASLPSSGGVKVCRWQQKCLSCVSSRFFSSKGDGSNASDGKHIPVNDAAGFDKGKTRREEAGTCSKHCSEHGLLGEQDQQEWLNNERLSIESRRKESPLLTKREKFKNELLRRVIPWEKISFSLKTFPYYINEHTKNVLVECAATHLKNKDCASKYGARLPFSSGRILLRGIPGTELYRERLLKALSRDLEVPLLVLDSSILVPCDFGGQECALESEIDDDNAKSGEEFTLEPEVEGENDAVNAEEWTSGNEGKSGDSDEDDEQESAKAFKNLTSCNLEEFAKRVSEVESTLTSAQSAGDESSEQLKRPLKKGDRVKYVGASVQIGVDNRSLSNGQCGEVYEVNGDQVAVILDREDGGRYETKVEHGAKQSVYWIDVRDIVHDIDTQVEDWRMAIETLCEVLPYLQPIIVYFPDTSQWLSRVVPKSSHEEFIHKVEEMFDRLPGPVVICGQNIQEARPKDKDGYAKLLSDLGRLAKLPLPLKDLTEGLRPTSSLKKNDVSKLFPNSLYLYPPKEEDLLIAFSKQIEDDRKIIIWRGNLIELYKVLEEQKLSCMELWHVKTDGVILTKQKAEKIVGWARNHYLSSNTLPSIKGDRLMIPRESLDIVISRLKEQETTSIQSSENLKNLAKDEYESNFISAVVPPDEIGIKFDDIGALEDVKRTLNELVTLPMRRPELFSHGNLLRPCKGILLFGPPGTGKTLLAKALATEAGANFISITGSTLTSKWFGDAEKLTKALFSFASKLAPVIIFVDEVDSLLGARGSIFEHEATRRMRNEFMAAWDGLRSKDSQRILILGATNRPFDLDDAVIRRLPRRIYVDLPDMGNRMKILRILLSKENLDPDFGFDELADATEGYTGSDLKNLCIAASYRPVQELLEEEKKGGVRSTTPSLRPLNLVDFIQAKAKVGASVAYDAASMNELRKWNDQYGEGGSRIQSPFGFGN